MARDTKFYKMLDAASPVAIASSTNAGPIEITTGASHGYSTGQKVTIVGHTTNTAANGSWTITVTGATTFTLDGSVGNGVGGATGVVAPKGAVLQASDFKDITLSFDTDGAVTLTVKVVGSVAKTPPDFAAPQGPENQWTYLQMISLADATTVNGGAGIVLAAASLNEMYEVNVNGVNWVSVIIEAGTTGPITVTGRLFGEVR